MQALYEGSCPKCSRSILVGQEITAGRSMKWAHRRCPGESDEQLRGIQDQDALPGIEPERLVGFTSPGHPGRSASGLRA